MKGTGVGLIGPCKRRALYSAVGVRIPTSTTRTRAYFVRVMAMDDVSLDWALPKCVARDSGLYICIEKSEGNCE